MSSESIVFRGHQLVDEICLRNSLFNLDHVFNVSFRGRPRKFLPEDFQVSLDNVVVGF